MREIAKGHLKKEPSQPDSDVQSATPHNTHWTDCDVRVWVLDGQDIKFARNVGNMIYRPSGIVLVSGAVCVRSSSKDVNLSRSGTTLATKLLLPHAAAAAAAAATGLLEIYHNWFYDRWKATAINSIAGNQHCGPSALYFFWFHCPSLTPHLESFSDHNLALRVIHFCFDSFSCLSTSLSAILSHDPPSLSLPFLKVSPVALSSSSSPPLPLYLPPSCSCQFFYIPPDAPSSGHTVLGSHVFNCWRQLYFFVDDVHAVLPSASLRNICHESKTPDALNVSRAGGQQQKEEEG
ncbi:unnamed protein product [Schistocephalus solidus]|uniref:Uncharacterized protein n=1 Tax=Schistocephalus solidus TaxID=70667 RepID=A0A183SQM1_SCHSO|nr:unnamed protein product [Schistocephalus solidus]